jgi:hypothetical protein
MMGFICCTIVMLVNVNRKLIKKMVQMYNL